MLRGGRTESRATTNAEAMHDKVAEAFSLHFGRGQIDREAQFATHVPVLRMIEQSVQHTSDECVARSDRAENRHACVSQRPVGKRKKSVLQPPRPVTDWEQREIVNALYHGYYRCGSVGGISEYIFHWCCRSGSVCAPGAKGHRPTRFASEQLLEIIAGRAGGWAIPLFALLAGEAVFRRSVSLALSSSAKVG